MLENFKLELIEIAKQAEELGLCKHKSGNFSLKLNDFILITPSGILRKNLTPDDICVINRKNNEVIESINNLKPSTELNMHLEIYNNCKNIVAIVHTHSKFATSFAAANLEIPPIISESKLIFGNDGFIKVVPYFTPGSIELAKNVSSIIKNTNVCLLERHGTVAVSEKNISDAFLKAQYIEEVAEIYLYNLLLHKLQ